MAYEKTIWGGAANGWLRPDEVRYYSLVKCFGSFAEALRSASDSSWSLAESGPFCFLIKEAEGLCDVPELEDVTELSSSLEWELEEEDNAFLTPWWGVEEGEGDLSWSFHFTTASGTNGVQVAPLEGGGVLCEYTVRSLKSLPSESSAVASFLAGGWKLSSQGFEEAVQSMSLDRPSPWWEQLDMLPKWERIGR